MQIVQALEFISLRSKGESDSPSLDAQILLAHILGKNRSWILSHPENELISEQQETLLNMLSQLEAGTPLPYLVGKWEFYGLEFTLSQQVLIPRPETELLVDRALNWLALNPDRRWGIDIGSGSGCIAIALAYNVADLELIAGDISFPALLIARQNASRYHLANRITFLQCDLFSSLARPFDLVCANLPYIPTDTLRGLPICGREPSGALDGGKDGLDHITRLLEQAPNSLATGGLLLCEIEARQANQVISLARSFFPKAEIKVIPDLAGFDRLLSIQI